MKGSALFQGKIIAKMHWWILKIFFSRTAGPISTKLGTNLLRVKGIQVCSNEGLFSRTTGLISTFGWREFKFVQMKGSALFQGKIIAKMHWRILKIFFSRTAGPISTNLSTKYPWVKGIPVYSNEGPILFQGEIITKLRKYIDKFKKIFSWTTWPISTKLNINHAWMKGIQVF